MGSIRRRGKKLYLCYVDADGTERMRLARGATTIDHARPMLAEIERRIMRGELGIVEPTPEERERKRITVAQLVARFLGDVEEKASYKPPTIKNLPRYRRDARSDFGSRVLPTLGSHAAASVKAADVEQLRDGLLERLEAASVTQTMAHLSKLYNWARRAGLVDCPNPVQGVARPPGGAHSVDFLSHAEVASLIATTAELAERSPSMALEARVRAPMVATAIYCGLRKGELFGLRWCDVQLDAARIDVVRSYRLAPKSGKARHVALHPEIVRVLRVWKEQCPATPEGLVFPIEPEPDRLRMGAEFDTLGLPYAFDLAGCHRPADGHAWHMLRHTFASHAVMAGASLYEVQRLLGHATPIMTQRYAHLAPDHLASVVARLSFAPPVAANVADIGEERRKREARI